MPCRRGAEAHSDESASHWFKGALEYSKAASARSGGFNQLAWRLYQKDGEGDYVTLAGLFDPTFLGDGAGGDGLEREHANFHEPIAMGAHSRYEITATRIMTGVRNFIELLLRHQVVATAGTRRRAVAGARRLERSSCPRRRGDVHAGEL